MYKKVRHVANNDNFTISSWLTNVKYFKQINISMLTNFYNKFCLINIYFNITTSLITTLIKKKLNIWFSRIRGSLKVFTYQNKIVYKLRIYLYILTKTTKSIQQLEPWFPTCGARFQGEPFTGAVPKILLSQINKIIEMTLKWTKKYYCLLMFLLKICILICSLIIYIQYL